MKASTDWVAKYKISNSATTTVDGTAGITIGVDMAEGTNGGNWYLVDTNVGLTHRKWRALGSIGTTA